MTCPCGSNSPYQLCCEPYHLNQSLAPSPEKLMRSRYSAYVKKDIDYLIKTSDHTLHNANTYHEIADFAESVQFIRLDIINAPTPNLLKKSGIVEFKAWYKTSDKQFNWMHEVSTFQLLNEAWVYMNGALSTNDKPIKLKRNDKCLCGSGQKFKSCCALR